MKKNLILAIILSTMAASAMASENIKALTVFHDVNNLGGGGGVRYSQSIFNNVDFSAALGSGAFVMAEVEVKRVETSYGHSGLPKGEAATPLMNEKYTVEYGNRISSGPTLHIKFHQFDGQWGIGGLARVGLEVGRGTGIAPNLIVGLELVDPQRRYIFDLRLDNAPNRPSSILLGAGVIF